MKNYGFLLPTITIFLFITIWQIATTIYDIEVWILPSPLIIIKETFDSFFVFLPHLFSTIKLVIIGFVLALFLGILSASFLHLNIVIKKMIFPLLIISQNIPTIVLAPLFLIWFGLGDFPKLLIITITAFFPIALSTLNALESCDKTLLHYAQMQGINRFDEFVKLKIPYAVPNIFSGAKISATYAISTGVVAEWLGAQQGIGVFMTLASSSYKTPQLFMAIGFIVLLSLAFVGFINLGELLFRKYAR